MPTASLSLASRSRADVERILKAGTLVGVLDLVFAVVLYVFALKVLTSVQVLQSIAGGLLGKATYRGGPATAALGAVLHFAIAYTWTTAYLVAYRRWSGLRRVVEPHSGAVLVGLAFGILVWLVMSLVVLPLSRSVAPPVLSLRFAVQLVGHAVFVGLPIALIVRDDATR